MSNVAIDLTKTVKEIITTMKTAIDNLNSDVATNKTAIDNLKTQILEAVYPVGSVYVSLTNSSNPADILGFGTWEALPAGYGLVAQGTATAEDGSTLTFTAGEKSGEFKHQLTVGEYLRLTPQDVKWRSHYFIVRQSKTAAGQGRAVPIHKEIYPWFVQRKNQAYICQHEDGTPYTYDAFRRRFDKIMDAFGMSHTPHECRHTCASMLDSSGANDTAVKKILGHACRGVTKHDYTHKTIHELRKAIDSI